MKVFTSGSAKIVAMKSDNLDIREFVANTEGMGRDERYIAAQRELRDADKLPYGRRKGATKAGDRKIEKYMADLKYWIQQNYH
jgi:hypothetical protein